MSSAGGSRGGIWSLATTIVPDLIIIIVTFGFFALSMGYGIFCDPL